ncbi:50S ribosomal protein L27 [Candidatus Daviesbacteria bacterium]|nr:50S ribosomal protein L27 [Candidatus Daviesbacteria bacterium]
MAHKTGGGSTRKNKDSISKRLGVKRFGGEKVVSGHILVRQKGNKFYPGPGAKQGSDYTIFATVAGQVKFLKKQSKMLVAVT